MGIVIRSVNGSEDTLMHRAERPGNYFSDSFTHYQAERVGKEVICVQIFKVIHQTEPSRVHVLSGTISFTYLSWWLYCCCVHILITTFPRTSAERIYGRSMGCRPPVLVTEM